MILRTLTKLITFGMLTNVEDVDDVEINDIDKVDYVDDVDNMDNVDNDDYCTNYDSSNTMHGKICKNYCS